MKKAPLFMIVGSLFGLLAPISATEFAMKESEDGIEITIDGEFFTKYHFGKDSGKPYLWPIIGPTGKEMTRAYPMKDVEGERQDHPHHRSLWFGLQEVNGFDTWHERLTLEERFAKKPEGLEAGLAKLGITHHSEVLEASTKDGTAILKVANDYIGGDGKTMMSDVRQFVFSVDSETESRVLDVTLTFTGGKGGVTLGDAKDSGFNVRVAHSISADAGEGGTIVNSAGDRDKDAWGKRAEWCDFNGPVDGDHVGIAMLDHPGNFRHPVPWHVRTYGLFTANPFGMKSVAKLEDGTVELAEGETLSLRYRVIFHQGDEKDAKIAEAFEAFAAE